MMRRVSEDENREVRRRETNRARRTSRVRGGGAILLVIKSFHCVSSVDVDCDGLPCGATSGGSRASIVITTPFGR